VRTRCVATFHEVVPETARLVFEKVDVLAGVASVENALEDVAHLEVVPGDRIASREPELMRLSRSLMPRIPFDQLDVLVVDYLGLADMLKKALAEYTEGDREEAGIPQEKAVALLQEKHEVVKAMLHGLDYGKFFTGTAGERLAVLPAAMEHLLKETDGKARFMAEVAKLSKAFALAVDKTALATTVCHNPPPNSRLRSRVAPLHHLHAPAPPASAVRVRRGAAPRRARRRRGRGRGPAAAAGRWPERGALPPARQQHRLGTGPPVLEGLVGGTS